MSDDAAPGATDEVLETLRRLTAFMKDQDLAELEVVRGDWKVRLSRGWEGRGASAASSPAAVTGPAPAPATLPAAAGSPSIEGVHITSPMVGTFYSASAPDSEPYVKVGSVVGPDTIVCLLEAMKIFNEIPAGATGRIVEVLVSNGQAVEYGQPLFRVASAG